MSPVEGRLNRRVLEFLIVRMLQEGVPPTVTARVLDLDVEMVRVIQSEVRFREYGTDDRSEYLDFLQWKAIEENLRLITEGSGPEKTRALAIVIGKELAQSARRTPESLRKSRDQVAGLMESMREDDVAASKEEGRSPFIVTEETSA